jgi:hypothetical protein
MSLVRLRSFVEVYRLRSLSSAARSLNLTQSNVSQHIAGLEVALGRPLFQREARGVTPTHAADELAADVGGTLIWPKRLWPRRELGPPNWRARSASSAMPILLPRW